MGGTIELKGPDLAAGIAVTELPEGEPFLGHAGGEPVVLVRRGDDCFAVGATCSHYSGPLAEGLVVGDTIRCPWHHARFDLRTGATVGGPGLNPLPCYQVERVGPLVRIGKKTTPDAPAPPTQTPHGVFIIGSGAAGVMVADTLRAQGYEGGITLVGEEGIPIDRPNLSKDFLAGTAPEEWLPVRDKAALEEKKIDLITARVHGFDAKWKRISIEGYDDMGWTALVIATGATPVRLQIPGAELPHVHVLRTLADTRAILAGATTAERAVVIGSGFIGLEAAASLRARGLEVTVVAPDEVPLARVVGEALGKMVKSIHEEKGVVFVRGRPASIDASEVTLDDGNKIPAELVIMGVGVRPRVDIAEAAKLTVDNGVVVDDRLRAASAPDVYAVGDVARFPCGADQTPTRVEHWVHAQRMAYVAARNILGYDEAFRFTPFFWSQHYDVAISYVGAGPWDAVEVIGSVEKRDVLALYRKEGRVVAAATVNRDKESLRLEDLLERGDQDGIEALARAARGRGLGGAGAT